MQTILNKYLRQPGRRRRLLAEAAGKLVVARTVMAILPFRYISPQLGKHQQKSVAALSKNQQALALDIAWAIAIATHKIPLRMVCIHQAMTAKNMLSSRGIPNTVYLGTRRKHDGKLEAHAWVISGDTLVTGGNGHRNFSVVACFA